MQCGPKKEMAAICTPAFACRAAGGYALEGHLLGMLVCSLWGCLSAVSRLCRLRVMIYGTSFWEPPLANSGWPAVRKVACCIAGCHFKGGISLGTLLEGVEAAACTPCRVACCSAGEHTMKDIFLGSLVCNVSSPVRLLRLSSLGNNWDSNAPHRLGHTNATDLGSVACEGHEVRVSQKSDELDGRTEHRLSWAGVRSALIKVQSWT